MRMPRAEPRRAVLLGAVAVVATGALLATGSGAGQAPAPATGAESWLGLVASRPSVALAQRVIVVLKQPSLAQRVAAAGGAASPSRERAGRAMRSRRSGSCLRDSARRGSRSIRTSASAACSTDSPLASAGAPSRCSSATPRSPASIRSAPPIRRRSRLRRLPVPCPAPASTSPARTGAASRSRCSTPGVDAAVPYLRGRVRDGIDLVGPGGPSQLERHGTEMAGLLVGGAGVATGASVLPIRVAGSQPDGHGHWVVYARSDQLVAGLDRAVDPNDDGDAKRRRTRRARSARRAVRGLRRCAGGARRRRRARARHARRRAFGERRRRRTGLRRRLRSRRVARRVDRRCDGCAAACCPCAGRDPQRTRDALRGDTAARGRGRRAARARASRSRDRVPRRG